MKFKPLLDKTHLIYNPNGITVFCYYEDDKHYQYSSYLNFKVTNPEEALKQITSQYLLEQIRIKQRIKELENEPHNAK